MTDNAIDRRSGDAARKVLASLIDLHGPALLHEPERLKLQLDNALPGARRQVDLILASMNEEVPHALLAAHSDDQLRTLLPKLVDRLVRQIGVERGPAAWVVRTWAHAFAVPVGLVDFDRSDLRHATGDSQTEDDLPTDRAIARRQALREQEANRRSSTAEVLGFGSRPIRHKAPSTVRPPSAVVSPPTAPAAETLVAFEASHELGPKTPSDAVPRLPQSAETRDDAVASAAPAIEADLFAAGTAPPQTVAPEPAAAAPVVPQPVVPQPVVPEPVVAESGVPEPVVPEPSAATEPGAVTAAPPDARAVPDIASPAFDARRETGEVAPVDGRETDDSTILLKAPAGPFDTKPEHRPAAADAAVPAPTAPAAVPSQAPPGVAAPVGIDAARPTRAASIGAAAASNAEPPLRPVPAAPVARPAATTPATPAWANPPVRRQRTPSRMPPFSAIAAALAAVVVVVGWTLWPGASVPPPTPAPETTRAPATPAPAVVAMASPTTSSSGTAPSAPASTSAAAPDAASNDGKAASAPSGASGAPSSVEAPVAPQAAEAVPPPASAPPATIGTPPPTSIEKPSATTGASPATAAATPPPASRAATAPVAPLAARRDAPPRRTPPTASPTVKPVVAAATRPAPIPPSAAKPAADVRPPAASAGCTRSTCGSVVSVRAIDDPSTRDYEVIVRLDDRSIHTLRMPARWGRGARVHLAGNRLEPVGR